MACVPASVCCDDRGGGLKSTNPTGSIVGVKISIWIVLFVISIDGWMDRGMILETAVYGPGRHLTALEQGK